jgi:hypothetical protein
LLIQGGAFVIYPNNIGLQNNGVENSLSSPACPPDKSAYPDLSGGQADILRDKGFRDGGLGKHLFLSVK